MEEKNLLGLDVLLLLVSCSLSGLQCLCISQSVLYFNPTSEILIPWLEAETRRGRFESDFPVDDGQKEGRNIREGHDLRLGFLL